MTFMCIKLYCILTNKTLRYAVLHTSVTQQIKMDCVIKAVHCSRKRNDSTGGICVMWQAFRQACSVGNFGARTLNRI
jgi:hypothetical protein